MYIFSDVKHAMHAVEQPTHPKKVHKLGLCYSNAVLCTGAASLGHCSVTLDAQVL